MNGTERLISGSNVTASGLETLEGFVVSWLPDSGLGFFETNNRRIGFKRESLSNSADKKISIGTSVVGEVNSSGFAVRLSIKD